MHRVDDSCYPLGITIFVAQQQWQLNVLFCGQRRHQVECLKDESDFLASQNGEILVVQLRQVHTVDVRVAAVKAALHIPVVANGDIDSPEKARDVLAYTGADAVMVGRAAQGRPWIFREISHFLETGTHLAPPLVAEVKRLLLEHLMDHYSLYGEFSGVRTARKHIGWYVKALPGGEEFRAHMNLLENCEAQLAAVAHFFDGLEDRMERMPAAALTLAGLATDAQIQDRVSL